MRKTALTFNILFKNEGGRWIAHCLELDIVATGTNMRNVKAEIGDLIVAAVDYAFSNDNVSNLFHPAPEEVWEEYYNCKKPVEIKVKKVVSSFSKHNGKSHFVPSHIIANACCV